MTIDELRTKTIADLGYNGFLGGATPYNELGAQQQINVTNAMEAYIAAHPDEFSQTQVNVSTSAQNVGGISSIEEYTAGQAISDFGNEVANQAVSLNDNLNPFSEKNRKLTYYLVIIGAVLYFFGPQILASLRKK